MLVEVERLSKLVGGRPVVREATLYLPRGKKLNIVGPRGSGKSMLLKMLVDIVVRDGGSVRIDGLDPLNHRKEVLAKTLYIPQAIHIEDVSITWLWKAVEKVSGCGSGGDGDLRVELIRRRLCIEPSLILIDSIDTLPEEGRRLIRDYVDRGDPSLITTSNTPDNLVNYDFRGYMEEGRLDIQPVI